MPWLIQDERVVAPLEIAATAWTRTRGLLGRNGIDGVLLLKPAKSVHTLGMRFPLDVAFCDSDLRVIDLVTMVPNRVGKPRWRAHYVIEAEAGSFVRWRLGVGDLLGVRDDVE